MTRFASIAMSALALQLVASSGSAGIHTWDVSEVFSDASGTIQYVELVEFNGTAGEVNVGNGQITSGAGTYSWSNGAVTGPTSNKFYLIATPGFAALPGAPTPDATMMPNSFVNVAGDSIAFGTYDTCVTPALPTDGSTAYNCKSSSNVANSPTNYAGVTGSVTVVAAPTMAPTAMWLMVGLMVLASLAYALRRRPATA